NVETSAGWVEHEAGHNVGLQFETVDWRERGNVPEHQFAAVGCRYELRTIRRDRQFDDRAFVGSARILERVDLRPLARNKFPESHLSISAAGDDRAAIGRERDGTLLRLRLAERIEPLAGLYAPELHGRIGARTGQDRAVVGEGELIHGPVMAGE